MKPYFYKILLICSISFLYNRAIWYLLISGDMMKPIAWMLSIEGEVVMGPQDSFINGIAVVFASYYNLNLQYPDDGSHTGVYPKVL